MRTAPQCEPHVAGSAASRSGRRGGRPRTAPGRCYKGGGCGLAGDGASCPDFVCHRKIGVKRDRALSNF
jgi:hypothetical protein